MHIAARKTNLTRYANFQLDLAYAGIFFASNLRKGERKSLRRNVNDLWLIQFENTCT